MLTRRQLLIGGAALALTGVPESAPAAPLVYHIGTASSLEAPVDAEGYLVGWVSQSALIVAYQFLYQGQESGIIMESLQPVFVWGQATRFGGAVDAVRIYYV